MKAKLVIFCLLLSVIISSAFAQGTALTYQGRLNNGSNVASGSFDLVFTLFNTNQTDIAIAGPVTNTAVTVTNGLFTTLVDFGPNIFIGGSNWLEIAVSTNGANSFTTLAPRQQVTPVPYAITAENLAGVVENNTIQNGVTLATISGGGGNIIQSGANDSTISGGGANNIGTNSFFTTIAGGGNNEVGANADTSTIGGGNANIIQDGAGVSTIAGGVGNQIQTGSPRSTISGGSNNQIFNNAQHSTIGGGDGNQIQNNSVFCMIGGGEDNIIQGNSSFSVIDGGFNNNIQTNAYQSTIGGGFFNEIQSNAWESTIGGGYQNEIQPNAFLGTIGGGYQNSIQPGADDSTIGGGNGNVIQSNSFESFIGGGQGNVIGTNAVWSTIGGGLDNGGYGQFSTVSGGQGNINNGRNATIGGGYSNYIGTNVFYSFIGGGIDNTDFTSDSVIGGGELNTLNANSQHSVIGGGDQNTIQTNAYNSTIGGGVQNTVQSNMSYSTIAGGYQNTAGNNWATVGGGAANTVSGFEATVPGGYLNIAKGDHSFAAGQQAQALNQGAFVWADSQSAAFSSTANDQFLVRAAGGVGINTNNPNGASLYVLGNRTGVAPNAFQDPIAVFENTSTATGSSPALRVIVDGGDSPSGALTVSANGTGNIAQFGNHTAFVVTIANDGTIFSKGSALTSDRNVKENFTALDGKDVLAKVISLPVTEWNYKDDTADKKHIGPMAQDFHAAFQLDGVDDKHIAVVDEGGVALAAIQGLNEKVEFRSQNAEVSIRKLEAENAELKQSVAELKAMMKQLVSQK